MSITGLPKHNPSRHAFVGCKVYRSTAKSLTNDTDTAIDYDSEDFDPQGMHDNVTNNTRLTIPAGYDGRWMFIGLAAFASNATGYRYGAVVKNGTDNIGHQRLLTIGASQFTVVEVFGFANMAVGDYVENYLRQTSGGALNTGSGITGLWFVAIYLGKA